MRALVISGGGSKGAFAGGVAQYLMQEKRMAYDLLLGTSTGSLLISHLALQKIEKIREVYTSVTQGSIFSNCPFTIHRKYGAATIGINHWNVLKNLLRGSKTFGESHHLHTLIRNTLSPSEFGELREGPA
ncbi:MAG: patatin-like phospholipase family protein, partial [Robiginitalea sp.]|nr:patatin-like phospholipase family protein [Robiginitalea sp.]